MKNKYKKIYKNLIMFTTVVLFQILAVSVGSYVNFALEEPCPEKYYGTPKCYIYTYEIYDKKNFYSKKRIYIKKPWVSIDDSIDKKEVFNQKS
tara:strand:+ start:2425 stop:2703 length:279 start_codon:yes stop_codon:yes gene_type:complete